MLVVSVRGERHDLRDAHEVRRVRLGGDVDEERLDLVAHERLLLEQRARNAVERRAVFVSRRMASANA